MIAAGLELRGVGYRFPSGVEDALRGVSLRVRPGELVLLTGPTGCGKSTLLRLAAGLLQRHGSGVVSGTVAVDGIDPATAAPSERVARLGFVSQSPERQLVAGTLGDEVAFSLESAGWSASAIEARIPEILAALGLPPQADRPVTALSGGQRQRLVVAAGMAARPSLLLLDEPLAQLDPAGARSLVAALRRLADEGTAILLVEHRLERALPVADRVVVLDGGEVVDPGPGLDLPRARRLGLSLPGVLDVEDRLQGRPPRALPPAPPRTPGPPVVTLDGATWRYRGAPRPALLPTTLAVGRGERVALLGPNGSGKSTLLGLVTGALCSRGARRLGRVVDVPQDPDRALFCATVRQELEHGPREQRAPDPEQRARRAARATSVEDLLDRPPQALSRGQRLRVAVAAALSCDPDLLVLDEPTSGQDGDQVERMMAALGDRTLLFATHDVALAARHATRLLVLEEGRVVDDGPPRAVLERQGDRLDAPELLTWCRERGVELGTPAELAGEG